jgi:ABC transport system ATP-binding/permease protein
MPTNPPPAVASSHHGQASLDVPVRLSERTVLGSDGAQVDVVLSGEGVASKHAQIDLSAGCAVLTDSGSPEGKGTLVNAKRVMGAVRIWPGDCIKIGPHKLVFDGASLVPASQYNKLVCRNLVRAVRDSDTGQQKTLLDDVTLAVRAGEFVCILGPSGSGKSKLLLALSNREPADSGQVLVDGRDFYTSFEELKERLAVVRQEEPLHDRLTVGAMLGYTAQLRLPADTSREQWSARVEEVLQAVRLEPRQKEKQVCKLSGGEKKRTILANEVLSGPSLLFVDEVTSGLDEETDREIMGFLRNLADGGTTVVCVTHSLANIKKRDLLLVVAKGGELAFFGSAAEAVDYFHVKDLRDLYRELAPAKDLETAAVLDTPVDVCAPKSPADNSSFPERWKRPDNRFRKKYVDDRLAVEPVARSATVPSYQPTAAENRQRFRQQALILTRRYVRLQLADWRTFTVFGGQCLLAAILLVALFHGLEHGETGHKPGLRGTEAGNLLFLLSISCLWFGCNNSAKEIVKEREIYLRERNVNLVPTSYYVSKIAFLWTASCLQVAVLLAAVRCGGTELKGNLLAQALVLVTLECTGVALGLLLSVLSKTNDVAATLVPIALLPQIMLAGVTKPLEGIMKLLAQVFVTSYSGFRALASLLDKELTEPLQEQLKEPPKGWSYTGRLSIVLMHLVVFMGAAMFVLLWPRWRRRR